MGLIVLPVDHQTGAKQRVIDLSCVPIIDNHQHSATGELTSLMRIESSMTWVQPDPSNLTLAGCVPGCRVV